jgi:hypothetical protein
MKERKRQRRLQEMKASQMTKKYKNTLEKQFVPCVT